VRRGERPFFAFGKYSDCGDEGVEDVEADVDVSALEVSVHFFLYPELLLLLFIDSCPDLQARWTLWDYGVNT